VTYRARLHRLETITRPIWVCAFFPAGSAEPTSAHAFDGKQRHESFTRADGESVETFRGRLQSRGADLRRADLMARAFAAVMQGGFMDPEPDPDPEPEEVMP
jgi:hypothetical protein